MARTKQTTRRVHSLVGEKHIRMSRIPPRQPVDYEGDEEGDEDEPDFESDPDEKKLPRISQKVKTLLSKISHI